MVEETSAAARNLSGEVAALSEQASRFNVGNSGAARASKTQARFDGPVKPLPAAAVPALKRSAGHDDWASF